MRVGIIGSRGYPSTYGGFETLVRRLAPFLADRGVAVTVFGRGGMAPSRRSTDGIELINPPGIDTKSLSTLTHGFTASIVSVVTNFDVLLVLNVAHGFFLPLMRMRRIPTIVNVDGIEWNRDKWGTVGKGVLYSGAQLVASHASQIVADSRVIARYWDYHLGRKTTYIPYGADILPNPGTTRIKEMDIRPQSYALVVARMVPENNVNMILDTFEVLESSCQLVLVGDSRYDHPLTRKLRKLARHCENVIWLGHVHDQVLLNQLWAHCLAYLHGHSVGGTNPSLLQAMGSGAPVVAFDTPYNREVLGSAGKYFGHAGELADRWEDLMADKRLRLKLGKASRDRIGEDYCWESVCSDYLREIRNLAE